MAKKKSDIQQFESELAFPVEGVDEQRSYSRQRSGTAADAMNVRAFAPLTDRATGGVRPGQEKFYFTNFDGTAVTDVPIQDINQLATTQSLAPPPPTGHYQQFTYGEPAGSGFGLGDGSAGSSIVILPTSPVAGYAMSLSCWDPAGGFYVAMVNTTTGGITIYKYSYYIPTPNTPTLRWTSAALACATGSLRNVCGLAYYEVGTVRFLFLALKTQAGVAQVWRLSADSGALIDGSNSFAYSATLVMTFSTNAVNVLAVAAGVLGVECSRIGSNPGVALYNPQGAFQVGTSIPSLIAYVYWAGAVGAFNTKVRMVSDGQSFYANASSGAGTKLYKMTSGGSVVGSYTAANEIIGVSYGANAVVITTTGAPYVVKVNPSTLALTTSASPGSAAQWDQVDSDNNGTSFLFRNAAANNFMSVDANLAAVLAMGAFNVPNANHSGISVNQGTGSIAPPPGPNKTVTVLRSLLVKGGQVMPFTEDGPRSITTAGSTSGFNGTVAEIFSAQNGPNMFYADGGAAYQYYKGSTDTLLAWTPTAGTLPVDTNGNGSQLICTWRGRTVLVIARNFYMSKQLDPFNWDYAPSTTTQQQAFAGNSDLAGGLGNLITCLIPFSDDTMIFGCDHAIYQLSGDPMANGTMDRICEGLGIAFGRPFAFDPQGVLYFFGSDCVIYKMSAGSIPVPISAQIRHRLKNIDLNKVRVRMAWDMACDGLGVWVSPLDRTATATHFFWERRVEGWQPEQYGDVDLNPMAVFAYDGDLPEDRRIFLGGADGFVRRVALDGGDDAGVTIESWVLLGPIKTAQWDDILLQTLQATLTEDSGKVRYDVYWGTHAEEAEKKAIAGPSKINGTWKAGRNRVSPIDREGFAFYVKLSSSDYWALERITQTYKTLGMVARRRVM